MNIQSRLIPNYLSPRHTTTHAIRFGAIKIIDEPKNTLDKLNNVVRELRALAISGQLQVEQHAQGGLIVPSLLSAKTVGPNDTGYIKYTGSFRHGEDIWRVSRDDYRKKHVLQKNADRECMTISYKLCDGAFHSKYHYFEFYGSEVRYPVGTDTTTHGIDKDSFFHLLKVLDDDVFQIHSESSKRPKFQNPQRDAQILISTAINQLCTDLQNNPITLQGEPQGKNVNGYLDATAKFKTAGNTYWVKREGPSDNPSVGHWTVRVNDDIQLIFNGRFDRLDRHEQDTIHYSSQSTGKRIGMNTGAAFIPIDYDGNSEFFGDRGTSISSFLKLLDKQFH